MIISFTGCNCSVAGTLKVLENFNQKIDINQAAPYKFLLENLPSKTIDNEISFKRKLASEENILQESDPINLRVTILNKLKLDELIAHYKGSPPKVEIVDEEEMDGLISQRLKISDTLIGTFEAKIIFPDVSLHKHPMILGIHGHGGNCSDFINRDMSSKLFNEGYGILSISFRAMRRLHESIVSRELVKRGYHLMGIRLYETYIGWQILKNHPLVNPDKIAILAHSGGSVIANLFVRVFPKFRALIYDYESSFNRDWSNLCCESLPNLRPFRMNLQLASFCPIPAIKVDYGFRKDSNIVVKFFSEKLGWLGSNHSAKKSKIKTRRIDNSISTCISHYASLQDKCLLRSQIDDHFENASKSESVVYSKLRRPRSKIQYLLEELALKGISSREKLGLSFDKILKIIKAVEKRKTRSSLLNMSNESICKLGFKQCDLWMKLVRNDPVNSIQNDFTHSVYVAALTSGSVSATSLLSHLPGIESQTLTLLNLLNATGKPESIDLIKTKLKVLLEKDSMQTVGKCLNELIEESQFKKSCWKHSLVSNYVSKLGKLPKQLKSLVQLDDRNALNYLNVLHDEPEDLLQELLETINSKPLNQGNQLILASQLDRLYYKRVRLGQSEGFIRELIPYLESFNVKFRHQWISRGLVLTQKDPSSYEAKASRLEIMEEVLKVTNRSELAKIISDHTELFDNLMLEGLISQALVIDRLDQADLLLKKLRPSSRSCKQGLWILK